MEQHLRPLNPTSLLHLHQYSSLCPSHHPQLLEPQQTCRTESTHRLHRRNIRTTLHIPHQSHTRDICRTAYKALPSPEQLNLSSARLEGPLHLKAKQATQRPKSLFDRRVLQDFRRVRRKLHWRGYGGNCSTRRGTPPSGFPSSYVAWQCILYV